MSKALEAGLKAVREMDEPMAADTEQAHIEAIALQSCPFCGSHDLDYNEPEHVGDRVSCNRCGAQGGLGKASDTHGARTAWNARHLTASHAALQAECARLRTLLRQVRPIVLRDGMKHGLTEQECVETQVTGRIDQALAAQPVDGEIV